MDLLHGWKQIAACLDLTVRTAQRWERFGLPVHRSNGSGSRVVAMADELERWARFRALSQHGYVPMSSSSLGLKLLELRSIQKKTHRRTRRLAKQVNSLGIENQRLLVLILSSLDDGTRADAISNAKH